MQFVIYKDITAALLRSVFPFKWSVIIVHLAQNLLNALPFGLSFFHKISLTPASRVVCSCLSSLVHTLHNLILQDLQVFL